MTGTDYFELPAGTTAQRPGSPTAGDFRYNTDDSVAEYYNGTSWVQLSSGGATNGIAQARLEWNSNTSIHMVGVDGTDMEINGEIVDVDGSTVLVTENLISSTGTNSGSAPPNSSAEYYVYHSNASASYRPSDLALSSTAPSDHRGSKYLATSGNGAEWRYVGRVYLVAAIGAPNFRDNVTQRHVASYYHRRVKRLFECPDYNNNNALTSYTVNSATFTSKSSVSYITEGDNDIPVYAKILNLSSQYAVVGIGDNSSTSAVASSEFSTALEEQSVHFVLGGTAGQRTINYLIMTSGTVTIYADGYRRGSSADPYWSYYEAWVYN